MSVRFFPSLLAGALAGAIAGCAPAPEASSAPDLLISGSETITQQLLPALLQAYQPLHPETRIELRAEGTSSGMRGLIDGSVGLAAASRRATPAEQEQARAHGLDFQSDSSRHLIAVNVVAVVAHSSNPLESLTYDQIIGIFCKGSIDNWEYLGLPAQPLRAVAHPAGSGNRSTFEDFFCGPKGLHRRVQAMEPSAMRALIESDATAIGFGSLSDVRGRVLGLRPNAEGPAVLPSQRNVIRGAYPLYHDLYLYSRGPLDPKAKPFIDWVKSPAGQEVVDQQSFVPLFLRPATMDDPRPLRETLHFDEGSKQLDQRSQTRLHVLMEELRERASVSGHIVLEGFADPGEKDPVALSQGRADAVRALLEKELSGTYFEIIPRGAENPLAPNSTPFGRLQNRRVQVYVESENRPEGAPATPAPASAGAASP
jgi:phosphate transport system substrate-binding protein